MKKSKKIIMIIAILLLIAVIGVLVYGYIRKATQKVQNPIATIEVEGFGTMKLELYPEQAPNTVANFIALANHGFYNGTTFHRIISDFMIQGGDKNGDGTGMPTLADIGAGGEEDYTIKGEFVVNGDYNNTIRHERGVISMARSDYSQLGLYEEGYNSAGSQFFIMTEDNSQLNGQYAAFGKIIEGYDVLDKLAAVEVKAEEEGGEESTPVEAPKITKIEVDTFGVDYGMPETQEPFDYQAWFMQNYGIDLNAMSGSSTVE